MSIDQAVIRALSADDVDIFRRIRLEALSLEPLSFASAYEDWAALSEEEWRQCLEHPVFVACLDGQPVGMMGLRLHRVRRFRHRATIVSVYVRKSERGTGVAAHLLDAVMTFAQHLGIRQLELSVNAGNAAAIRFYQRHAFAEVGRIPNGFGACGREIDELIMVLRLDG